MENMTYTVEVLLDWERYCSCYTDMTYYCHLEATYMNCPNSIWNKLFQRKKQQFCDNFTNTNNINLTTFIAWKVTRNTKYYKMKTSCAFYFLNSLKYCVLSKDNFPWHRICRTLMLSRTQKAT